MDISGVWVLFDCPMDLSSVTIFSPRPLDSNAPVNDDNISCSCQKFVDVDSHEEKRGNGLIYAEPRYRTVKNLLSWNISFIDVVLISSPMGMLGLPYLTRNKDFSAKVDEVMLYVIHFHHFCLPIRWYAYDRPFGTIWWFRCMQLRLPLELGN